LNNKMEYPINNIVRVILENNEKEILFLKRATATGFNKWALPGGKVEYGQSLEMACIEEMNQETDLKISGLKFLFYEETLPFIIDKNHWITFYFSADYFGEIQLNEESSASHWISRGRLPNYDVAFGHEKVVQKYFEKQ